MPALSGCESLVFFFLDLDGFKEVNDHYGHRFGDTLLVRIDQSLQTLSRDGDVFGCTGGDEFRLIVPNFDRNVVRNIDERLVVFSQDFRCSGGRISP